MANSYKLSEILKLYGDGNKIIKVADSVSGLDAVNRQQLDSVNTFRADHYLASQDIAKLVYDNNGNLVKIQYNQATDVDYQTLSYDSDGNLTTIKHYINKKLSGTTTLSYDNGVLVSAIFN